MRLCPELWAEIFKHLPPHMIRQVRLVCKYFRVIIDNYDGIFIASRLRMFGSMLPGPPDGLSELKYSVLLEHNVCQRCGKTGCRRTLWGFARRWCQDCFQHQTRSVSYTSLYLTISKLELE